MRDRKMSCSTTGLMLFAGLVVEGLGSLMGCAPSSEVMRYSLASDISGEAAYLFVDSPRELLEIDGFKPPSSDCFRSGERGLLVQLAAGPHQIRIRERDETWDLNFVSSMGRYYRLASVSEPSVGGATSHTIYNRTLIVRQRRITGGQYTLKVVPGRGAKW